MRISDTADAGSADVRLNAPGIRMTSKLHQNDISQTIINSPFDVKPV